MACDDKVLHATRQEGKDYAGTILRVAESFDEGVPAGAGFLGLLEMTDNLLQRIRSASDMTRPRRAGLRSAAVLVMLAALFLPMGVWTPSSSAEVASAVDAEISQSYAQADAEVKDFVKWTAAHFGPQGLWLPETAFEELTSPERKAKLKTVREALEGTGALSAYTALAEAGALRDPSLLPGLVKVAWYMQEGGQDNRSKWMAVAALGRLGDKSAVPVLIPLVDHYNKNVRLWARASLVRLTGQSFGADKKAWADWANAAGAQTAITPAILEWASRQSEERMKSVAAPGPARATTEQSAINERRWRGLYVDELPGKLIFKGTYKHRSRGHDLSEPSTVWLKQPEGGALIAASYLPAFATTYVAYGSADGRIERYVTFHAAARGKLASKRVMDVGEDTVTVTHEGGEKDGQVETLTVPDAARFDPNSRPDPYVAANLLVRMIRAQPGESTELTCYDWDNTGKGMAGYDISIVQMGKEAVTVPAGTFEAHHLVQTQTSFGDTWYKKRPGHVTDFWVLDNGVIVRILRHREPYEVLLASYESPDPLPGLTQQAAAAPQPGLDLVAEAEKEIQAHYAKADPDVQEYTRWTARTFGRGGLWRAANAYDRLSPEERDQKVQHIVDVLKSEYGRHLCAALADAGALRDQRLLPGLVKAAGYHREDRDYDCRPKWMAVAALGRQDDESAVPTLVPLVDHGNQNTRMWARASLVRLTGQNFGSDKQAWGTWWNDSGKGPKIDPAQLKPWTPPAAVERRSSPRFQATLGRTPDPDPSDPTRVLADVASAPAISLEVPAKAETGQEWFNTGITVTAGADLEITAAGTASWDPQLEKVGPQGMGRTPQASCGRPEEFLLPTAPCGGLVGKVGDSGTPFFVGERGRIKADSAGPLYLGINDRRGYFGDNDGAFKITVVVRRSG